MERGKDIERLLRVRRLLKSKKPEFLRTLWWKFPKFKNDPKWRKPKGIDNPMRLRLKGRPPVVDVGYRAPAAVRGLHPTGLEPVRVSSPSELDRLDPSRHIIYIAAGVGLRKRQQILEKARAKGFRVANA
ncbi:50S ribosomal protein L32E [Pyrodictium delaneyi]|uniref:Large ribosomal subunit protein eL32 n=1 Tax=Pyrodictium delaneyi TaxID=1273541 RepID=A0A0P0N3T8_9CREN|nr:50S ribosomal protein L32e [Pyrodictium delaneyi]ALL01054.1 50S ribosomal protein L32E [Pyrodictium delaneyi]OWJ55356.1 50S ribosomal protein L32e [Pyrodictium delaneyi]